MKIGRELFRRNDADGTRRPFRETSNSVLPPSDETRASTSCDRYSQQRSLFFTTLPPELRIKVYSYVLTVSRDYHVVPVNQRVHRISWYSGSQRFVYAHTVSWHGSGTCLWPRCSASFRNKSSGPASVMLSCRRMLVSDFLLRTREI
jgi:hypothetical protein